jgi:hypothetical protein
VSSPLVSYADKAKELDLSDPVKRIKASFEMRRMLDQMAGEQRFLASSFMHVGNRDVAAQLYEIAESIEAISEKWRESEGLDSTDRLRQAQDTSATILQAALAGAKLRDIDDPK